MPTNKNKFIIGAFSAIDCLQLLGLKVTVHYTKRGNLVIKSYGHTAHSKDVFERLKK